MSELCCKFSGGDNALLISLEAAFDRGSGAKIVAQGKKLGGICVVCWWGWVWGEVFTQFKMRKMKLPCSVLKNHISILSTIPFSLQQCNIKESHWHQLDFDQWMIAEQRMPRSRLGFHNFTTTNPKSVIPIGGSFSLTLTSKSLSCKKCLILFCVCALIQ